MTLVITAFSVFSSNASISNTFFNIQIGSCSNCFIDAVQISGLDDFASKLLTA